MTWFVRAFCCFSFVASAAMVYGHPGHDHSVPSGVWPVHTPDENSAGIGDVTSRPRVATALSAPPVEATVWRHADGTTGASTDAQVNANVSGALADVNTVAYDDDYVYLRTSGVPSHAIGPFGDGNPNVPGDQDATYRILLNPTEASVHQETVLANIGVTVNGVGLFNWSDATTWNAASNRLENMRMGQFGDWNTNALWFRKDGLDEAGGHPAGGGPNGDQNNALYHYHQSPYALVEQIDPGNNGDRHSPVIGFAFDGFPIYGPHAYANGVDDTDGIMQMTSSYQLIESRPADGPSESDFELG